MTDARGGVAAGIAAVAREHLELAGAAPARRRAWWRSCGSTRSLLLSLAVEVENRFRVALDRTTSRRRRHASRDLARLVAAAAPTPAAAPGVAAP